MAPNAEEAKAPLLDRKDDKVMNVKPLKSGPDNTPRWKSGKGLGDEWAKSSWWTPAAQIFPNVVMIAIWVPLNLLILAGVAWPVCYAYYYELASLSSCAICIVTFFVVQATWYYFKPDFDPKDNLPPKKKKVVAVIGAGPAGLCVAKELIAEGHTPIVFERDAAIGGTWQRGCACTANLNLNVRARGRVLPTTITSSSALNTCYSDFPIQAENPGHDPFHMSQADYMDYVLRYAKYFDLERHVQLNREVVEIQKIDDDRWEVKTKGVGDDDVTVQQFDAVSICSGQVNVPRIPAIDGRDHFQGDITHIAALRGDDPLACLEGKRVLCIGSGETASDVAYEVTKIASRCDISIRNPLLVLPRNLWGVPPDYVETRSMYLCARWVRWATYKASVLFMFVFNNAWARSYKGKVIWVPSVTWIWKMLFTPKYFREVLLGQRSACASLLTTKSDHILYALENRDKCSLRKGLCHIDKDGGVVFQCGTKENYDVILLLTGYNLSSYPFLAKKDGHSCLKSRYLGTFDPDLPNLAFIGFMRGNVGSLILGFEMQARWFALLCSNKRQLPSVDKMKESIAHGKKWNHAYNSTAGSYFFANYLARHHVGCEPNFIRFFVKHPLACIKAYCGNFTSYQFRMRGPHMDPQSALDGYALTDGIFYTPIGFHCLHIIWMLQAPFFELWSHLPIIGRYFTPHTSNWY